MNNDLISRDELLETFMKECLGVCDDCKHQSFGKTTYCELIVTATTVKPDMALLLAYESGKASDEEFVRWVAKMIFDGYIEDSTFCELACRKLVKIGIVEEKDGEYFYTRAKEGEEE